MIKGLVSTIIPTYNRAEMLREAVASVMAQTYRPIEIIVVDDGSTDETAAMLQVLSNQSPGVLKVLRQANAGAGPAREAGLQAASGEFIQFLDSDDLLKPEKFKLQVEGLRGDLEAGISYGITLAYDPDTDQTEITHGTGRHQRELLPGILNQRLWPTLTPLYRREVCHAIGPWSRLRVYEDWDYDCRAALLGVKLHYCPDVLALVRHHWGERAGRGWLHDKQTMRDRATAYINILAYARASTVSPEAPEMRQLVRSVFWMAREVGAYGLEHESATLFGLAHINSLDPGWDYRIFRWGANLLGWRAISRLFRLVNTWRDRSS